MIERLRASERLDRSLNGVMTALLVVGLGGLGMLGLKHLESYVNRLPVFTASEVSASFYALPKWMSYDLAHEILTDSFRPLEPQIAQIHRDGRDQEIAGVLTERLSKNAWVRKVFWTRRSYGGQFIIHAEFREPTAVVAVDKSCYMIDEQGFLLPGKYRPEALSDCGMLEIHGCAAQLPPVGHKWAADDLQAGLELVRLLANVPFRSQIRAVNVANYGGRTDRAASWITLTTDRGTTIRWGKPIGKEGGLETTAEQKIALLAAARRDTGHID